MNNTDKKRINDMLWSGRYVVKHLCVRADQEHPPEIFSTDSLDQVATWLDMEGQFYVYDQKTGRILHTVDSLHWNF